MSNSWNISVRMSPARFFLVRAKDFQAGQFECRPDQLGKYTVEINRVALAILLDPERHCDKSV